MQTQLCTRIHLKILCEDYDNDCDTMTFSEAQDCYNGLINHPCAPPDFKGLEKPTGICPILSKLMN